MKPQTSGLVVGKLKHRVLREPIGVALYGKIQGFGGNVIEFGQVCIGRQAICQTLSGLFPTELRAIYATVSRKLIPQGS
jgi:hypothetical protein